MKRSIFLLLSFVSFTVQAQFKADNVKYTTVYPEDLCKTLLASKGYLLLDVRSPGEFDDTSSALGLNIGHLKPAKHIDIQELAKRWRELNLNGNGCLSPSFFRQNLVKKLPTMLSIRRLRSLPQKGWTCPYMSAWATRR